MNTLTLTVHNRGLTEAFSRAPEVLERHMSGAVLRSVMEMARDARRDAPKAESTLTHSIRHIMADPLTGEVAPGVNYARMAEEGTGPGGVPPHQALLDWIRGKGITPNDPGMTEEDLAFVISRSIARHGTPAQPYLVPALEKNKARAERKINRAITMALREMRN